MVDEPSVGPLKQLFDAIEARDRERIEALLGEQPSLVNTPVADWEASCALHAAAGRADAETVALLLRHGGDPAGRDAFGNTPLHRAVTSGGDAAAVEACLDLLVGRPEDLGLVNHNGHTPLRHALWFGSGGARAPLLARDAPLHGEHPAWTAPADVAASVAAILSRAWNGPVTLGDAYRLRGERVLRFDVAEAPEVNGRPAPASVVVKRAHTDEKRLYDPASTDERNPACELLNEWAGTQLLTEMPGSGEYALRLYGGDKDAGLFVIEDLGDGDALVDLLMGEDPKRAEEALRLLAVSLGKMHAETIGQRERLQEYRNALGLRVTPRHWHDPREHRERLHQGFEVVGVTAASGFDEELEAVARSVMEPGPFLAFVHGDPCPDNCRIVDGRLRLFDFTGPGFRHALSDALYGRIPFPTCWCVNRLPAHVPPMMEAAYRAELSRGCPEAADDARFYRELVHCMAAWFIFIRIWWLENARGDDWRWGISTWRQRVLVRLDAFAAATEQFGHLPAMGETARRCTRALREIWPPEADAMPFYPVFRERVTW